MKLFLSSCQWDVRKTPCLKGNREVFACADNKADMFFVCVTLVGHWQSLTFLFHKLLVENPHIFRVLPKEEQYCQC